MEVVEKAGVNGLIAGVTTGAYFGFNAEIASLMGASSMPLYVLAGLVGAGGSVIGDIGHVMIKETVPVSKKFNDQASVVGGMGINGLLFAAMLYCYQPEILNDFGATTAVCFGAGSELAGSALYTYLKENQYF